MFYDEKQWDLKNDGWKTEMLIRALRIKTNNATLREKQDFINHMRHAGVFASSFEGTGDMNEEEVLSKFISIHFKESA